MSEADGNATDERGFALIGRYLQAFSILESTIDDAIASLFEIETKGKMILCDNVTFFNKIRILESVIKANYSSSSGQPEFKKKKDQRLGKLRDVQAANDFRVIVAHRNFEIEQGKITFRYSTAKNTLKHASEAIAFNEMERKVADVQTLTEDLQVFLDNLDKYVPKMDFSDSRNSGCLPLL